MIPKWIWIPAGGALALVALPLLGMLARVPWGSLPELLGSPAALQALGLSLLTSVRATFLPLALGAPLAFVRARSPGRAGTVFRGLVVAPLGWPPGVTGRGLPPPARG